MHFSAFILLLSSALYALAAPTIQPIVLHSLENTTSVDNSLAKRAGGGKQGRACINAQQVAADKLKNELLLKPTTPFSHVTQFFYATDEATFNLFNDLTKGIEDNLEEKDFMDKYLMNDGVLGDGMYLGELRGCCDHCHGLWANPDVQERPIPSHNGI